MAFVLNLVSMSKKGIVTIGLVIGLFLASPFVGSAVINIQAADEIYKVAEQAPEREVALVLGAAVYNTRLSDILRDRVDTAIELYEAKKVNQLYMSGSAGESKAMKSYAVDQGVEADDVIEDPIGLNTMASVKNIATDFSSVSIVTQRYHLPRALFIARSQGLDAIGVSSDKRAYLKIFEFKKRELLATTKAILEVFLKREIHL